MLLKDGLADLRGHAVPVLPYLYRRRQTPVVAFNPDYQYTVGNEYEYERNPEQESLDRLQKTRKTQVLTAVTRLKSKTRQQIVRMILQHGKSIIEVAEIMGCTYSNVFAHLYGDPRYVRSGAIAQLRAILSRDCESVHERD